MLDRPAFPGLLPAKPAAPAAVAGARPAAAAPSAANRDAGGVLKIVVAFLSFLVLANLILTLFLNQPKDSAADNPLTAKVQAQEQSIQHLTEEITALKAKIGLTINNVTRIKNDQAGLSSRVSTISAPPPALPYSMPMAPEKAPVPSSGGSGGSGGSGSTEGSAIKGGSEK